MFPNIVVSSYSPHAQLVSYLCVTHKQIKITSSTIPVFVRSFSNVVLLNGALSSLLKVIQNSEGV